MPALYYPDANRRMLKPDGYGPFITANPEPNYVFLCHTTETRGLPSYSGGLSAPHLTGDPRTGIITQDVYLNRAAGALKGWGSSGGPTNHARVHQMELVTYSSRTIAKMVGGLWVGDWTDDQLRWLGGVIAWFYLNWGKSTPHIPYLKWRPKGSVTSADEMSFDAWWWNRQLWWFVTDHASNPDDSLHWDVGALNVARAVEWAVIILNGSAPIPPTPEVDEMFCKKGETSLTVEYWQRLILAIDENLLPGYGADGNYGSETVFAVSSLVTNSNGEQIGPEEMLALNQLAFAGGPSITKIKGNLRGLVTIKNIEIT